ncbi:hypothetical protein EJ07DRAFT_36703, partial [Lizonia empirigonia]
YSVERSTLSSRHRGVQGSPDAKTDMSRLLNTTQEATFIRYIDELRGRGLPPSKEMIQNFASEIAGKPAGKHWVDGFIKRH